VYEADIGFCARPICPKARTPPTERSLPVGTDPLMARGLPTEVTAARLKLGLKKGIGKVYGT
jgi:hypothetical protein